MPGHIVRGDAGSVKKRHDASARGARMRLCRARPRLRTGQRPSSTDFTEDTENHDAPLFETPRTRVLEIRGAGDEV